MPGVPRHAGAARPGGDARLKVDSIATRTPGAGRRPHACQMPGARRCHLWGCQVPAMPSLVSLTRVLKARRLWKPMPPHAVCVCVWWWGTHRRTRRAPSPCAARGARRAPCRPRRPARSAAPPASRRPASPPAPRGPAARCRAAAALWKCCLLAQPPSLTAASAPPTRWRASACQFLLLQSRRYFPRAAAARRAPLARRGRHPAGPGRTSLPLAVGGGGAPRGAARRRSLQRPAGERSRAGKGAPQRGGRGARAEARPRPRTPELATDE